MRAPVHPHLATAGLLLFTASTGVVDAASYLALDKVFTGNMTGNVLFIGFALVGVDGIPLLNNVLALLGFAAGAIIGGRVVGRGHADRSLPQRAVTALAIQWVLLVLLALSWALLGELAGPIQLAVTAVLAIAMGVQSTAVKPIGNADVTTIVVTSTILNLARDSRIAGGSGERWIPRVLAILAMTAGAGLGAGTVALLGGAAALGLAAILSMGGLALLLVAARRGA